MISTTSTDGDDVWISGQPPRSVRSELFVPRVRIVLSMGIQHQRSVNPAERCQQRADILTVGAVDADRQETGSFVVPNFTHGLDQGLAMA